MTSLRTRAGWAALALLLVLGPPAWAQPSGLTLAAALALLPSSPGWQKADLDYQSAADALAAAQAAAGLQVSAGGSVDSSATLAGSGGRSGTSAKLSVSASATVLPWAPADAGIANAEANLAIAARNRDSARKTLMLTLVQQYFAARLAATTASNAAAAADQAQAELAADRAKRLGGQLSAAGLAQAEASSAAAQAALAQARTSLDLARRALFATLGQSVSGAQLTTPPPQASGPAGSLAALVSTALPKRDDVQVAKLRLAQAERTLATASAQRWIPSASLNLGVAGSDSNGSQAGLGVSAALDLQKGVLSGTASYPVAGSGDAVGTQLTVGASLSIPLDAPSSNATVISARTSLQSARAALEATRQTAELDIRQRYGSWQGAEATLAADQASEAAAKQSLATAQARQAAGLATALDVGSAQVAYRQAQRALASDENALYLALLQLRNALGELQLPPRGSS